MHLDDNSTGMEYGVECTTGIGVDKGHGAENGSEGEGTRGHQQTSLVTQLVFLYLTNVWAEAQNRN